MTTPSLALRDIERCPACGGEAFTPLYGNIESHGNTYRVDACTHCGLGVTVPFPDAQTCARLYGEGAYRDRDRRFVGPVEWAVRMFRRQRLRGITSLAARKGRMLDVGCGRGMVLHLAAQQGWQTVGIEYNDETAAGGRTLGVDMRTGALSDQHFEEGSFDVVSLWHSLEHIPEAERTVHEAIRILRPGGLLVIAVPNFESWQSRFSRQGWFHLDVPFHLYHFPASALRNMLERSGIATSGPGTDIAHFNLEQNVFGWLQSILNRLGIRRNALYDMLKTRTLRDSGGSGGNVSAMLLSALLLLPMGALALLLSALEALAGRGATVTVYGVKR